MKSWRSLFSQNVLSRGREYYHAGKAKKLSLSENPKDPAEEIYEATVRGTRNYHVRIQAYDKEIESMSCTCPYSAEGNACKHEASVLMAIEDEYGKLYAEADPKETAQTAHGSKSGRTSEKTAEAPEDDGNMDSYEIVDRDGNTIAEGKKGNIHFAGAEEKEQIRTRLKSLQEEAEREREGDTERNDAAEYHPDDYRYFHPESFRSYLRMSADDWEKAEQIAHPDWMKARPSGTVKQRGKAGRKSNTGILELSVSTGYRLSRGTEGSGPLLGQAVAKVSDDGAEFRVTLIFDRHRIIVSQCGFWECRFDNGYPQENPRNLCVHEMAVLILLEEYLKENNIGDASSYEADQFLTDLSSPVLAGKLAAPEISGSLPAENMLTLEPRLELGDGLLSAVFYVGHDRLYKIKDLNQFSDAMRRQDSLQFGSTTTLALGENKLCDEKSISWYHFLASALADIHESKRYAITENFGAIVPGNIKANLPLYGSRLDRFAELIADQPFELWDKAFSAKDGKKLSRLRDQDITVDIQIRPVQDKLSKTVDGIRLTGLLPTTFHGLDHLYYYEAPYLYRLTEEASRRIEILSRNAENGNINFIVGRQNLSKFYRDVLPNLKKIANVQETDCSKIQNLIPPEPEFTAYLDYDRKTLICRLEAVYGREVFYATDVIEAQLARKRLSPSYRDSAAEADYSTTAHRYFHNFDPDMKVLYEANDDDAIFDLLDHGISELMQYGQVRMTPQFKNLGIRRTFPVKFGVDVESNLLDLSISSEDLSEDEMYQILSQYRAKKKYIRLKDGSFLSLKENKTIEELNQMLVTLQIPLKDFVRGKLQIPAYRSLYLDKMLETTGDLYAVRDRHFKQLIKEFKTVEDADFEVPGALERTLRKYQKDGYRWLRVLDRYGFGGILADEMGLGKTIQIIAVLLAAKDEKSKELSDAEPHALANADSTVSLVICPASLVYNWEEELHRFAPGLKTLVIAGTAEERKEMLGNHRDMDVLVTSYDLLKRDIAEYEGLSFHYEILDEAQYIKNPGTVAAKAVKLIHARTRYALTGTPIENRLSELWSIFDYLMPGFLYHYEEFRNTFEQPIINGSQDAAGQLKRMTAPFILRRLKKDVLRDLPDKLEEVRYVRMGQKQQELYDAEVLRMKSDLSKKSEEDFRRGKLEILAAITRIRQICCDPSLCCEKYQGDSAKREAVLELIHTMIEEGHRGLLFSQFTSMLALIREDLTKEKIPFLEITGATKKEERIRLVREFNENPDIPIFLISLKAGGTGLNLTGADVVIHYDPWWNTSAEDQATDRAHRIGQKNVVTVYKMVIRNSIEDRILELQKKKKDLADQILNGEALSSSVITREDLMQILS